MQRYSHICWHNAEEGKNLETCLATLIDYSLNVFTYLRCVRTNSYKVDKKHTQNYIHKI